MLFSVRTVALSKPGLFYVLFYKASAYSQMLAVCIWKSWFRAKEKVNTHISTVKNNGSPADIDLI